MNAAVTAEQFRNGMGRLGSGVCIVTTDGPHGRAGFTASSVCSVSDAPPTLLVCLQRTSSAHAAVTKNGVLCVHTLGHDGMAISRLFGGKTPVDERFAGKAWATLATGAPVLQTAPVVLDCRISHSVSVATHEVLFCEVVAMKVAEQSHGTLVYFDRRYHLIDAHTAADA